MATGESAEPTRPTAIMPAREQIVDFYGDPIPAAQTINGEIYVPLHAITDFLGLSFGAQRNRVLRDPVLSTELRDVIVHTAGGEQRMACLPLKLLHGWLFGIQASRVSPELRDKVIRYQRDCYDALWTAFKGEALPPSPPTELSGAALAYEIATAIQSLARQQMDLEARLGQVAGRQEVMAEYLRGYIQQTEGRLIALELHLSSGATISEAQAAEIALAVKNVGKSLERHGDRQGYARVYSELYRRYRISSYKNLPAAHYQDVLEWLHGWYTELQSAE